MYIVWKHIEEGIGLPASDAFLGYGIVTYLTLCYVSLYV